MTGRDDLDELHSLAASISEDAHGIRQRRRRRSVERAQARALEDLTAPVKHRFRRRVILAAALLVLVLGVVTVAVVRQQLVQPRTPPRPAPRTATRTLPPYEQTGRQAAADIARQGRSADVFSCQAWYDQHDLAATPADQAAAWHAGFITACTDAG
jgi:hypothetical protein